MPIGRFTAFDVETANADLASICQVGVLSFSGGDIGESWQSLVNPEDEFDPINISIHVIDEAAVRGAPRFVDIAPKLSALLTNQIVATHMALDRVAVFDPQGSKPTRSGNPDGELFGEVAVFTGALSMLRREAADMAAQAGCEVVGSVGKTTTLLIVGDQDVRRLAGREKSSKHRKAEELIAAGQIIRVLAERDFRSLLGLSVGSPPALRADVRGPRRKVGPSIEQPKRADFVVPADPVRRNLIGIELEDQGLIDNAIECYEANARDGFDGNHPYDRLAIIYRRSGEVDKELTVLRRAIDVFESLQASPRSDIAPKLAGFRQRYQATLAKGTTC